MNEQSPNSSDQSDVWTLAQMAATFGEFPEVPESAPREEVVLHFRAANLLATACVLEDVGIETPLRLHNNHRTTRRQAEQTSMELGERLSHWRRYRTTAK